MLWPRRNEVQVPMLAAAQVALGEAILRDLRAQGGAMTLEQAVTFILGQEENTSENLTRAE